MKGGGEGSPRRPEGLGPRGAASRLSPLPSPRSLGAGGGGSQWVSADGCPGSWRGNGIFFAKRRHLLKTVCKADLKGHDDV